MTKNYFGAEFENFFTQLLKELQETSIDFEKLPMDHVCYRSSAPESYKRVTSALDLLGSCVSRAQVNGREISVYRLKNPARLGNRSIEYVELPAPSLSARYEDGWEHCEFVIGESFESFMERYPKLKFETQGTKKKINPDLRLSLKSGSVRFHHLTLERIIDIEKRMGLE